MYPTSYLTYLLSLLNSTYPTHPILNSWFFYQTWSSLGFYLFQLIETPFFPFLKPKALGHLSSSQIHTYSIMKSSTVYPECNLFPFFPNYYIILVDRPSLFTGITTIERLFSPSFKIQSQHRNQVFNQVSHYPLLTLSNSVPHHSLCNSEIRSHLCSPDWPQTCSPPASAL
jgi:hypothetical protein